jgi:hypothetical protein
MASPSQLEPYATRTDEDGVEIVTGLPGHNNYVPVADYGTLYRPDPKVLTDHLGIDTHYSDQVADDPSETANGIPAQGFVPPSNHWGDNILTDDPGLADVKRTLDAIANADGNRTHDPVTHSREETDYDPEEKVGDVIPERDKADTSDVKPEVPEGKLGGRSNVPSNSPDSGSDRNNVGDAGTSERPEQPVTKPSDKPAKPSAKETP